MVKAPTTASAKGSSHYAAKFKPWRRGKSAKHKKNDEDPKTAKGTGKSKSSSLKHQLRGLERLLAKTKSLQNTSSPPSKRDPTSTPGEEPTDGKTTSNDHNAKRIQELEDTIDQLKKEQKIRQTKEVERTNARKSHKCRFLDRQRLLRLWQQHYNSKKESSPKIPGDLNNSKHSEKSIGNSNNNKDANSSMLYGLGLDMLYVAHYPLSSLTYQPLFVSNKQRQTPRRGRALAKLVSVRQHILPTLVGVETPPQRAAWIPSHVYEHLLPLYPSDWSTSLERATFGTDANSTDTVQTTNDPSSTVDTDNIPSSSPSDDPRFSMKSNQSALDQVLQAADLVNAELDRQEQEEQNDEENDQTTPPAAWSALEGIGSSNEDDSTNSSHDDEDKADPLRRRRHQNGSDKSNDRRKDAMPNTADARRDSEEMDSSSSDDSSSSSDEDGTSLGQPQTPHQKQQTKLQPQIDAEEDSSSSDSSSSSDEDEGNTRKQTTTHSNEGSKRKELAEDMAFTRDDKRTKITSQKGHELVIPQPINNNDDDDNGFLIADDDSTAVDPHTLFDQAKKQHKDDRSAWGRRGDKSQGWSTQQNSSHNHRRRGGGRLQQQQQQYRQRSQGGNRSMQPPRQGYRR